MSMISFLLPRVDYSNQDYYDLLDSILTSMGFNEDGFFEFKNHAFRKYQGPKNAFVPLERNESSLSSSELPSISIYMQQELDEDTTMLLGNYGIYFHQLLADDSKTLYQFEVNVRAMPMLAKLCPHGIRASKRIVEERSYYRHLDKGGHHGTAWSDWFEAEHEANEHLNYLLKSLA